ncbi:hypothetical protein RB195_011643 [Necator americanus]
MRYILFIALCTFIGYANTKCTWKSKKFYEGFVSKAPSSVVENMESYLGLKLKEDDILVKFEFSGKDKSKEVYVMTGQVDQDIVDIVAFTVNKSKFDKGRRLSILQFLSKMMTCSVEGSVPSLKKLGRYLDQ